MIGKLSGKVDSIFEEYLILDVGGVGYRVFSPLRFLLNINIGDNISLSIQTIVREDAIILFGFSDNIEKDWFETLCKVNGVGNKMALKIMGTLTIEEVLKAIDVNDTKSLCKAPGVGQKIANRIMIELKDVKKNFKDYTVKTTSNAKTKENNKLNDALSAIENLGYSKSVAYDIIVEILEEREEIVIESLITETLKRINKFKL
jgi:Holliday junction DNA helicase RuvA